MPQTEELLATVKQLARNHLGGGGANLSVAEFLDGHDRYPLGPTF